MAPIIEPIVRFLSSPVGNLIYSIVLGLSVIGTLISCLYAKGNRESREGDRVMLGLLFLLLSQLLLVGANWLAWIGIINEHAYLPPLDHAIALFSLALIIWLWAYPKGQTLADVLIAIVEIAIVILGGAAVVFWLGRNLNNSFNSTFMGGYAYYLGVGFLVVGLILLLWRRPRYWVFGFLMLLILLAGYGAQYYFGQANMDYSWSVHLGEMVAYVLLLALPLRLINIGQAETVEEKPQKPHMVPTAHDPKLVHSIINLVNETSPQRFYEELTQVMADIMDGAFCLLMMPPKTGEQILVPVAYDRLNNRMIDGFTADGRKMTSLIEALRSGKSLTLNGDSKGSEVQTLVHELGGKKASHLMMVPFHPKGASSLMGITVLSRSLDTVWNEDDTKKLADITELLVLNLSKYPRGTTPHAEQAEMTEKLQAAEARADQVRLEYAQLKAKYDSISSETTHMAAMKESMTVLVENEKFLQDTITSLETRNRELQNQVVRGRPSMEEVEQLRQELRSALSDLARVPSTLSKSDQIMLEQHLSAVKRLDGMQPTELVTSIAQEFRQPIASITGYTDLLLGESMGLLGAVQRKFLERVKASTERMTILLDELVQIMSINGGKVDQTQVRVDAKPVIDEAIDSIDAQIGEKNITLKMDIPDELPAIQVNKDALQQVLSNLLENACMVTPPEGEIKLTARVEERENEPKYMLISVTDQGGGIERSDLPRVFSRRYKAENPLIQGVGDTGVGLSIVKSLVELNKGRVWVDTQIGEGSTYSVLLPLAEGQDIQENLQPQASDEGFSNEILAPEGQAIQEDQQPHVADEDIPGETLVPEDQTIQEDQQPHIADEGISVGAPAPEEQTIQEDQQPQSEDEDTLLDLLAQEDQASQEEQLTKPMDEDNPVDLPLPDEQSDEADQQSQPADEDDAVDVNSEPEQGSPEH